MKIFDYGYVNLLSLNMKKSNYVLF